MIVNKTVFDILKVLIANHKNMNEKQPQPETFFDVAEVYDRLDQAIYDYKERLETYGQTLSEETSNKHASAKDFLNNLKESNPPIKSEAELIKKIDDAKMTGNIDEATHRLIMSQVY